LFLKEREKKALEIINGRKAGQGWGERPDSGVVESGGEKEAVDDGEQQEEGSTSVGESAVSQKLEESDGMQVDVV
jgi:hypothetical protein